MSQYASSPGFAFIMHSKIMKRCGILGHGLEFCYCVFVPEQPATMFVYLFIYLLIYSAAESSIYT